MKLILILILILILENFISTRKISKREEDELDREVRNAECCQKKMRCCKPSQKPPIEIRSILARCPNLDKEVIGDLSRTYKKPLVRENERFLKAFQGFDEDEPLLQSRVKQCRRKMLITLKINHQGVINDRHQFIVIDHVYDPMTEKTVRLLNPYVIRLEQQKVHKSYHLKFLDFVNSHAYEEIYNKHDGNYTGCRTDKQHATCGIVKFEGKPIPYSEGFCCSCDAKKNQERQPESVNERNKDVISYSDPVYLMDRVHCPRDFSNEDRVLELLNQKNGGIVTTTQDFEVAEFSQRTTEVPGGYVHNYSFDQIKLLSLGNSAVNVSSLTNEKRDMNSNAKIKRWKYRTYNGKNNLTKSVINKIKREEVEFPEEIQIYMDYLTNNESSKNELIRKIRQTSSSGIQIRGLQNCASRHTPPGLDPIHYHESTHCLRFSELWYGIYKMDEPAVEQSVFVNVYERFETELLAEKWREITNGTIKMSNRNTVYEDAIPSIAITFSSRAEKQKIDQYKALASMRILIPEIQDCERNKYPETAAGPDEYLVVKPDQIAVEGDQCDKIGVGFEAFFKQPLRCGMPRQTCLKNQPSDLWRRDKTRESRKEKGCYFLKNHANITTNPIYTDPEGEKYLEVIYQGAHYSVLDFEIKADFNAFVRLQTTAVITEVYIDSTCEKTTSFMIKVTNTGLISSKFMVQLSDFPLELPDSLNKIKSKFILISPQNQHTFFLDIEIKIPSVLTYCSVEVLNANSELVALRRGRIQKNDRCICTWHCLCACIASTGGLKCAPMSLEHYHAAGFQGSIPMITYTIHYTLLDDLVSIIFYFAIFLLAVLLLLGILKGILGCFFYPIGIWGLGVVLDLPKKMNHYYEKSLRKENVIYDVEGYPIHPQTKIRVRNISRATQFCANVLFFYTYPLACTVLILRRLCCPYYTKIHKTKKHGKGHHLFHHKDESGHHGLHLFHHKNQHPGEHHGLFHHKDGSEHHGFFHHKDDSGHHGFHGFFHHKDESGHHGLFHHKDDSGHHGFHGLFHHKDESGHGFHLFHHKDGSKHHDEHHGLYGFFHHKKKDVKPSVLTTQKGAKKKKGIVSKTKECKDKIRISKEELSSAKTLTVHSDSEVTLKTTYSATIHSKTAPTSPSKDYVITTTGDTISNVSENVPKKHFQLHFPHFLHLPRSHAHDKTHSDDDDSHHKHHFHLPHFRHHENDEEGQKHHLRDYLHFRHHEHKQYKDSEDEKQHKEFPGTHFDDKDHHIESDEDHLHGHKEKDHRKHRSHKESLKDQNKHPKVDHRNEQKFLQASPSNHSDEDHHNYNYHKPPRYQHKQKTEPTKLQKGEEPHEAPYDTTSEESSYTHQIKKTHTRYIDHPEKTSQKKHQYPKSSQHPQEYPGPSSRHEKESYHLKSSQHPQEYPGPSSHHEKEPHHSDTTKKVSQEHKPTHDLHSKHNMPPKHTKAPKPQEKPSVISFDESVVSYEYPERGHGKKSNQKPKGTNQIQVTESSEGEKKNDKHVKHYKKPRSSKSRRKSL